MRARESVLERVCERVHKVNEKRMWRWEKVNAKKRIRERGGERKRLNITFDVLQLESLHIPGTNIDEDL